MKCHLFPILIFFIGTYFFIFGCGATISSIEKTQGIEYKVNDPNASYFDVEKRMAFINKHNATILSAVQKTAYDCSKRAVPDPVDYYLVMPAFYKDRSGWDKANEPLERFERHVTELAELYVTTGKTSYVRCFAKVLREWAEKESLLAFDYQGNDHQAWFAIEWSTSSAALAYSIVRNNTSLESGERKKIENWLNKLAKKQTKHSGGPTSCCNNHSYWRGLEAAIVGVVSNDNALFRFGIKKYIAAINSMSKNGSFPLEMARGRRAIHYQNFAILPLVYIAEIAARQGYDLYSLNIDGKDLHLAINFLMRCIEDNDIVKKYTTSFQDTSFIWKKRELNWMEPYNLRFENEEIEIFLNKRRPIYHRWSGGNSTLYFYSPEMK
jgi:poly(beta-D-mannuronate) lyase